MRKIVFITVVSLIFTACLVYAGIWEPDPSKIFYFENKSFIKYNLKKKDLAWIESLIKNLRKHGSVKSYFTFVKTDLSLSLNGTPLKIPVYVNSTFNNQFLIYAKGEKKFLIDFGEREVYIPCGGGLSFHSHQGNEFIIVADPVAGELSGIPISSGGASPTFTDKYVKWH